MLGLLPHMFIGGNMDPCRGTGVPDHAAHILHALYPSCRLQSGINRYPGLGNGSHLVSVP